jgi:hypothetical protein
MDPRQEHDLVVSRRNLLKGTAWGLGAAALSNLLSAESGGVLTAPHFAPRARRVIWLFMSGAPSQIDTWDHKPKLREMFDQDIPESVVGGQRFTTMTSGQTRFPIAPSIYEFAPHGACGTEVSELLPYTAQIVDDLCLVKTVHTKSINHDPGITFIQTGSELPGRPSMGAWLSYGLGRANEDLPAFVVLHSSWSAKRDAQALYSRLWGSGFLPSEHQGVALRSIGDPVLYLNDPPGVSPSERRRMLDGLAALNARRQAEIGDPEIAARIQQYEMAYRMQTSVPDLVDLADEPESVLALYGPDVRKPGTFAYNCLLARRLAERDVRCIQVFIRGWDQHGDLPRDLPLQCRDVDQASAALVTDLKQRGMLEDTLVVWGGEFGRTTYCQGALTRETYGRDHHPRCFSTWLAGGGVRSGMTYGETDDFSYNVVDKPVHVHDLNATILHCLGIDHERLTYRFQGRDFRLTDVEGRVVRDILA